MIPTACDARMYKYNNFLYDKLYSLFELSASSFCNASQYKYKAIAIMVKLVNALPRYLF